MAFINEFIPESDINKYGIEEIDRRYMRTTFQPHWTIDRERDIYLRLVGSGREEFATQKDFTFYWKGMLIPIRLDATGGGVRGGSGWSHYKLLRLDLPETHIPLRQEILNDLKLALDAYKGGGVYSSRSHSTTTFEF